MIKTIKEESFGVIPLKHENGQWFVLLILHLGGRHWAFPKGRGNQGETPQESASRELLEETGLLVEKFLQEMPLTESYSFHRAQNEIVSKTVHYFPSIVKGELKLQEEEIRDAKWVPLKEAVKHLTFKEARWMCQELMNHLTDLTQK